MWPQLLIRIRPPRRVTWSFGTTNDLLRFIPIICPIRTYWASLQSKFLALCFEVLFSKLTFGTLGRIFAYNCSALRHLSLFFILHFSLTHKTFSLFYVTCMTAAVCTAFAPIDGGTLLKKTTHWPAFFTPVFWLFLLKNKRFYLVVGIT